MRVASTPLDGTNERQHRQQLARAVNALIGSNAQATEYGGLGSPLLWGDASTYVPGTTYDGTIFSLTGTWRCMGFIIGSPNISLFVRIK